jgi:hypothetical protein
MVHGWVMMVNVMDSEMKNGWLMMGNGWMVKDP